MIRARTRLFLKQASVPLLALVLSGLAVALTGDTEFAIASLLIVLLKLNILVSWAWFSGKILDKANGENFATARALINDGNLAVAINRTGGYAVLVIAGAMLLRGV